MLTQRRSARSMPFLDAEDAAVPIGEGRSTVCRTTRTRAFPAAGRPAESRGEA